MLPQKGEMSYWKTTQTRRIKNTSKTLVDPQSHSRRCNRCSDRDGAEPSVHLHTLPQETAARLCTARCINRSCTTRAPAWGLAKALRKRTLSKTVKEAESRFPSFSQRDGCVACACNANGRATIMYTRTTHSPIGVA